MNKKALSGNRSRHRKRPPLVPGHHRKRGQAPASRQWVNEVEKGKTRTEVGLALRALDALDVTLWLDRDDRAHDEGDSLDIDSIDIDEIVDNARGKG